MACVYLNSDRVGLGVAVGSGVGVGVTGTGVIVGTRSGTVAVEQAMASTAIETSPALVVFAMMPYSTIEKPADSIPYRTHLLMIEACSHMG